MTILIISLKNTSNYRQIVFKSRCSKRAVEREEKSKTLKKKKENIFNPFMKNLFLNNISYTFSQ